MKKSILIGLIIVLCGCSEKKTTDKYTADTNTYIFDGIFKYRLLRPENLAKKEVELWEKIGDSNHYYMRTLYSKTIDTNKPSMISMPR